MAEIGTPYAHSCHVGAVRAIPGGRYRHRMALVEESVRGI
jgi:hypothetical protein